MNSFGKPDILCNNAGIMAVEPRFLSDLSEEAWERTININLKSVFLCCKYTLPEMMNTGRGSIINISSIAAVKRSPNYAYAASKGGIVAFTQSLALQYGEYNIRANAVCPGSITTPAQGKGTPGTTISGRSGNKDTQERGYTGRSSVYRIATRIYLALR